MVKKDVELFIQCALIEAGHCLSGYGTIDERVSNPWGVIYMRYQRGAWKTVGGLERSLAELAKE